MTTQLRNRYDFFRAHAGSIGRKDANGRIAWEHAKNALDLARAEELIDRAQCEDVVSVEWFDDDLPWDEGTEISAEEAAAKFASNEWTGPYVVVVKIGDDVVASLSGIVVGPRNINDPYCRVVVAELACEIREDLREALSDALDTRITCPVL